MSDVAGKPGQVHATTRRSRRFSAIWLLPLVALAIGAWLAWDTLSKEGPTITNADADRVVADAASPAGKGD